MLAMWCGFVCVGGVAVVTRALPNLVRWQFWLCRWLEQQQQHAKRVCLIRRHQVVVLIIFLHPFRVRIGVLHNHCNRIKISIICCITFIQTCFLLCVHVYVFICIYIRRHARIHTVILAYNDMHTCIHDCNFFWRFWGNLSDVGYWQNGCPILRVVAVVSHTVTKVFFSVPKPSLSFIDARTPIDLHLQSSPTG